MGILILLALLLWACGLLSLLGGTSYTLWRLSKSRRVLPSAASLPPVTILKPLKGKEEGMEENLRTFFELEYPSYELIFCIADPSDSAIALALRLMGDYPNVKTRLHMGAAQVGANPKVNNLLPGYDLASYDLILISDSNVRVWKTYLKEVVACLTDGVGVVTAVVAGRGARGLGGRLEATYLNTAVARWMQIAYLFGHSVVIGKTMLFRKSVMERFGGLRNLAHYVAEDYMTGQAMQRLGYRTEILPEPVAQYIGQYSFRSFWSRHLRWGRIRRSQSPPGFLFEPFQYAFGSGLIGAWAFWQAFSTPFLCFLAGHLAVWAVADLCLIRRLEGRVTPLSLCIWCLRELLAIPHWLHMVMSSHITWRGHSLRLYSGGLVRT